MVRRVSDAGGIVGCERRLASTSSASGAGHVQSPWGYAPIPTFCCCFAASPQNNNKKDLRGWLRHPQAPTGGDFAHALASGAVAVPSHI